MEFMLLGINIFWALLRAHFNPSLTVRAETGSKHIYAREHKLLTQIHVSVERSTISNMAII